MISFLFSFCCQVSHDSPGLKFILGRYGKWMIEFEEVVPSSEVFINGSEGLAVGTKYGYRVFHTGDI